MKYNIHVYVVCWNEIDIVKFVVDYWNQYATRVVVYDNGSDDGTIEYLSQFENIEIRHFDTEGLDDTTNMNIKNSCWKESIGIADYVVVGDFDECIFSPYLEEELDYMRENNMTLCGPVQYALQGDHYPNYENGKFLHELITRVRFQKSNHTPNIITSGKLMLFDPNKISDINYGPGCHTANPIGEIKLYDRDRILCIHVNKGFGVEYNIKRKRILQDRVSEENKKHGYAAHYSFSDEQISNDYQKGIAKSVNILDVLDNMKDIKKKKKIAIFSCMMGGYDIPTDNFEMREGYDYYLFLDKAIHTECWQLMKPMFTNEELSPVKKARFVKTHPFAVLPDYDIVVWVDANTTIDDKLYDYIDQHKYKPITFKQHPYRDCIYEEIKMCCLLAKETQPMCLKLFERYNYEHFPTHYGLYETNVIIYHPHDPNVQMICNAWWNEIENFSHRDQLSLTYVLWKNSLKDFINVGHSEYFNPKKHLRN